MFVYMAYQRTNHLRRIAHIIAVYNSIKEPDKPDTVIIDREFPKHGIYISYRRWMQIKSMKPSDYCLDQLSVKGQLNLFA